MSVENLTKKYANGNNPGIIGRDKEMQLLILTMMRHEKPNGLLVGEPGVGKTALVDQLAYLISNNLVPKYLKGFQVLSLNTNALLAGPGYRGVTEEKFETIIQNSLSNGKTILFVDEFHTVEHLGEMANGQTPGLGNTLKPYLTRKDFRLIGATTVKEYKGITDTALLRRLFKITVNEPSEEAVKLIIRKCFEQYGKGFKISKGCIDMIYDLTKPLDGYNPDKSKDLTDFVCSYAKLKEETTITSVFISDFFNEFYLNICNNILAPEVVFE